MSKKQYMKPEMTVVITNPRQSLLVGSVRGYVNNSGSSPDILWGGVDNDDQEDWGD